MKPLAVERGWTKGRRHAIAPALLILTLVLASLPGTALAAQAAPKGTRDNPIRVGAIRITGFAPAYLLNEIGNRMGVYFNVIDFPRTTERLAALLRGDIDVAFAGWTGLIQLVAQGDPLVAVSGAFNGGYTLTVSPRSGIKALEDLKGKRIAYSIGSNAELHLHAQLDKAGLTIKDVTAVHMGFPEMPVALSRGDIDACFCSEPQSSIVITQGNGILLKYPYDTAFGSLNGVVITTRRFLQENREAVKALLRVQVMATDYLNTFADAYQAVGRDMFKQPDPVVNLALRNTILSYSIDTAAADAMADLMLRLGQIRSKPDVQKYIDLSPLREVLTGR